MTTTAADPQENPSVPWRKLVAAIAAVSVAGVAFGHSLPLFSILLELYGASDSAIGLNAGAAALAAILATPFFPPLIIRIGHKPFILCCLLTLPLTYGGLYLAGDNIPLWYPLRFLFGAAAAGLFVASEIWINSVAPPPLRGRIIGIYGTCLALGFAIGPLLIDAFGYEGFIPFAVGMLIFTSAAIPILLSPAPPAAHHDAAKSFFDLLPKAPVTFGAATIFAGIETAVLVFLPVFALEKGWAGEVGARAVSAYAFGIVAFQYLIGRLSDTVGYNRTLLTCSIASTIGAVFFWMVSGSILASYGVLFLYGGAIAGIYTVGLTLIGDRFGAHDLAAANTGFVFTYGLGAVIIPILGGFVRDIAGPAGFNVYLIVILSLYAGLVIMRRRERLP